MKKLQSLQKIIFMLFVIISGTHGQYLENSKYSGVGLPYFEVAVYRQFAFDKKNMRVMVMSDFLYDDLSFQKSDSGTYDAEVKLVVAIYNDKDRVVNSRIVKKMLSLDDYTLTNSRNDKISINSEFLVEPGKYVVLLKSIDMLTDEQVQRKVQVEIPDFSKDNLSVSDIRLYRDVTTDTLGRIIKYIPAFGSNFTDRVATFYAAFDIFSKADTIAANIQLSLINKDNDTELDTTINKILKSALTTQVINIPIKKLTHNSYTLRVEVKTKNDEAENDHFVSFFWTEVPGTEEDIDLAFRQMNYIAAGDSLDYYEDKSLVEKRAFFKRFWKRRDPNPDTEKNELQDEFFKRINLVNRNFSAFSVPGWRTDRGRILIKFGKPDEIDRHPFEMDRKPYVIWRYYGIRKEFVFEDVSGFGDYRLHPSYYNVEYE